MAEGLIVIGLVSGIAQLVDFATKVVGRLNEFHSSLNEAPQIFRDINNQLPLLILTLERMQSQANARRINEETAEKLKHGVNGCLSQVKRLEDIMATTIPAERDSTLDRRLKALTYLAHKKTVQHIRSEIDRYAMYLTCYNTSPFLNNLSTWESSQRKPVFTVKFDRDPSFIGRENIIKEIDERFKARQRRVAITGIGGVGKSQIAIEYCYRYKGDHPEAHIFWVHASNRVRFKKAYRGIAKDLALPGFDDPNVRNILQLVPRWLSDDAKGPWLLVLDNADDIETFFGCSPSQQNERQPIQPLVDYLPRSSNGSILITTRDRRVGERLTNREISITVLPFGMGDAMLLLRNKLRDDHEWYRAGSGELLEALDFLPLPITQAAAYIRELDVTLAHYLSLLRSGNSDMNDLLEQDYYDSGRDYESQNSIFSTWKISFDQIRKQKPRAAEILSLMAVLDRQSIPENLLHKKGEGRVGFDTAIGTLKAFSLVTEEMRGAVFGMHQLVQLSMQWWLKRRDVDGLVGQQEKALEVVSACCPSSGEYDYWAVWEAMTPHIVAVLGYTFETEPCLLKRAAILNGTAWYDSERGEYETAYYRCIESQGIRQKALGKEHPDTLASMNTLALVLCNRGKYEEAEEMNRRALDGRRKVLGEEHRDTLISLSKLAEVLKNQGKYDEAEETSQRAVAGLEKLQGKEHPDTLMSVSNLAEILTSQGKYGAAEEKHRGALQLKEKALGEEHPVTLISASNMALVLQCLGKNEEAEKMTRRALKGREKMLGKEHAGVLTCVKILALVLQGRGDYCGAEDMIRQVLGGRERLLGREHPSTLTSVSILASVHQDQGRYEEAEKMHRRALEGRERVLRKGHPDTLISVNNMGLVLRYQGKYEAAEQSYRQALEGREKLLRRDHPDTLTTVSNIGLALQYRGKFEEAEQMQRRALEGREKVLGEEHPDTLTSASYLASVFRRQGRYKAAEEMDRRTLEGRDKVLGKWHPHTLRATSKLGAVLQDQGKVEEAERMIRYAKEGMESVLGKDHIHTLTATSKLALILQERGKHEEAEGMNFWVLQARERLLGKEHHFTLTSASNLASVYRSQGKDKEAREMCLRALKGREKVLGKEHPLTLASIDQLASLLQDQGEV